MQEKEKRRKGFIYLCGMIRFALFWACMLLFLASANSQNAANPFEMKHRLPKESVAAVGSVASANPFDVKPHRVPGVAKALTENAPESFRPSAFLPRSGDHLSNYALFWIMLVMFMVLTAAVAANRKVVGKAWRGFLNDNGLAVAQREASGFVDITPYFLLYGNFILNAGMFMFLLVRVFRRETFNNLPFLLLCFAVAAVIFLSKHFILSIAGWLFPVEKEVRRYNFLVVLFNCVLGLFLVPFNFLLAFSSNYSYFWVFWTLGLVAVFYLYRSYRSGGISSKFLADNHFHFLLYLCTVEIAPVLLLVKLAMIQMD